MSIAPEVGPLQKRSTVCRPCPFKPRACRVICTGVGVGVGVNVADGVGVGVNVADGVGVGVNVAVAVAVGVGVGVPHGPVDSTVVVAAPPAPPPATNPRVLNRLVAEPPSWLALYCGPARHVLLPGL